VLTVGRDPLHLAHGSTDLKTKRGISDVATDKRLEGWRGIDFLTKKVFEAAHLQGRHVVESELRKALEPLLEKVEFACTLNFTDHDRKLLKEELDRWRES